MSSQFPVQGLSAPTTPWHLWGNSSVLDLSIGAGGSRQVVGTQLARANYKRPENFRFFFGGRLLDGIAGVGAATEVYAFFDLKLGVGRSVFDTLNPSFVNFRSFCTMHWRVPAGVIPGAQPDNVKWTTTALATPLDDATPTVRPLLQLIPAQDIQVEARMFIDLAPSPVTVRAELTAFLAPNVHVRPDWFRDTPDNVCFRGAETGGS
jgi:hypothetical protein